MQYMESPIVIAVDFLGPAIITLKHRDSNLGLQAKGDLGLHPVLESYL